MKLDEAQRRDAILRCYVLDRDWDQDGERQLVRRLVQRSAELLPHHPYLVGLEWEAVCGDMNEGRGDLLFADGLGLMAVVEVKRIADANDRGKARRKVEEQGQKFARVARRLWPDCKVVALVFTDDAHPQYAELRPAEKPANQHYE